MSDLSDWFECSQCGETDVSVKRVLGLGNFSVNVECSSCRFRHVERDKSSDNWNQRIKLKQYLTGRRLKAPKASRKAQKLVNCPRCHSENVEFWVYSNNSGLGNGDTTGHVRLDCQDCNAVKTTESSHS